MLLEIPRTIVDIEVLPKKMRGVDAWLTNAGDVYKWWTKKIKC